MIARKKQKGLLSLAVAFLGICALPAQAAVEGISGSQAGGTRTFNLTAAKFNISTPDGARVMMWGYGPDGGVPQYPGPTLLVNQGETVVVNLSNTLPESTSIEFPGHSVSASGDAAGLITSEAAAGTGSASYTFTATDAGTYLYNSATRAALQVEMGLFGAIVVYPDSAGGQWAYNHAGTAYDREYMFILSEVDPKIHLEVEFGLLQYPGLIDNTEFLPTLWFINGRPAPDSMAPSNAPLFPNQPYGSMTRAHAGDVVLMRIVSAGRDSHPFHTHGNHLLQIARDGRMTSSTTDDTVGPDTGVLDFTLQAAPGATYDALFSWTGAQLGFDIYGPDHGDCVSTDGDDFDDGDGPGTMNNTNEYCPDHGKPFPVILPELQDLTFGGFYSGSPFLGVSANLPYGEGGLNINGGLFYMWHSHNAVEQVNNDAPPGGMATMFIIEPSNVPIP